MHEEDVRVFSSRGLSPGVGYRLARDGPAGKEASYSYYGPRQQCRETQCQTTKEGGLRVGVSVVCVCVYVCIVCGFRCKVKIRVYEGRVNQHPPKIDRDTAPIDLHN